MAIVTESTRHKIKPKDINTSQHFFDAFDNTETEISAGYIVRLCQKKGGWFPFTKNEIEAFYRESGNVNFTFNRLIEPEMVPPSLARAFAGHHDTPVPKGGGWVVNINGMYHVTDDFIVRCFKSSPAK